MAGTFNRAYDQADRILNGSGLSSAVYRQGELKHGGQTMSRGLSGINKSININGQPHSLAGINPGEASALKAMGGSGKKVGGIPAYFDEWSMGEDPYADTGASYTGGDDSAAYDFGQKDIDKLTATDSPVQQVSEGYIPVGTLFGDDPTLSRYLTHGTSDVDLDTHGEAYARQGQGQEQGQTQGYTWQDPYPDKDKGPAGGVPYYGGSDPLTKEDFLKGRHSNKLNPYINALYASGMITDQVGDYLASLSPSTLAGMREAYDTGYSFGGPMGTMRGLSRDQGTDYEKKLKLKKFAKELQDLKDKNLSQEELDKQKGELFSKYQDIAKEFGANITENKRFKGMYSGLEEEAAKREGFMPKVIGAAAKYNLLPGSFATAGLAGIANLLTDLFGVVGEFTTKEGQSYRLMEDGTLVEPDIYTPSQSDNDPMASIQKPRPVRQASVSEEVDKPFTGIAALQQERSEVASISERLQPQFDNIASIFGREKAAEMLGQPENIFA